MQVHVLQNADGDQRAEHRRAAILRPRPGIGRRRGRGAGWHGWLRQRVVEGRTVRVAVRVAMPFAAVPRVERGRQLAETSKLRGDDFARLRPLQGALANLRRPLDAWRAGTGSRSPHGEPPACENL